MSSPLFRFVRITGLGTVAAFVLGVIRSARRQPVPPTQGTASWEPLGDDVPTPTRTGPVTFTDRSDSDAPATETDTTEADTDEAIAVSDTGADEQPPWVEPDSAGECPVSHPIKGNDQSKIFHVPGGGSYARTKAERCYCDETAALADGYRKAKR